MSRTFTGSEFSEALAAGHLKSPIVRVGMAKPDDDDRDAIQFADGTNCSGWTKVPVALIEKVEFIRNVPCRDHEHPLVMIELKSPTGDDDATVFADLLRNVGPQAVGSPREVTGGPRSSLRGRAAYRRQSLSPIGLRRGGGGFGPVDPQDCYDSVIDNFFDCGLGPYHCRLLLELGLDVCDATSGL